MEKNLDNDLTKYKFNARDNQLVAAATSLLNKVIQADILSSAQLVSVAKLRHVYKQLPLPTSGLEIKMSVTSPRKQFNDIETFYWWDVGVENGILKIGTGGHFYRPSTGGDSFSVMDWTAYPGEEGDYADYLDSLSIVPDAFCFEDAVGKIDFSSLPYRISVEDSDNVWLEDYDTDAIDADGDNDPEENEESLEQLTIVPIDDAEKRLLSRIDLDEVNERDANFAYGISACDFCACELEKRGLFVDGKVRGDIAWANMCAPCYEIHGEGIGWGIGQIYARQPNCDWRLVAGFQ